LQAKRAKNARAEQKMQGGRPKKVRRPNKKCEKRSATDSAEAHRLLFFVLRLKPDTVHLRQLANKGRRENKWREWRIFFGYFVVIFFAFGRFVRKGVKKCE
jgi:hypothetical protein